MIRSSWQLDGLGTRESAQSVALVAQLPGVALLWPSGSNVRGSWKAGNTSVGPFPVPEHANSWESTLLSNFQPSHASVHSATPTSRWDTQSPSATCYSARLGQLPWCGQGGWDLSSPSLVEGGRAGMSPRDEQGHLQGRGNSAFPPRAWGLWRLVTCRPCYCLVRLPLWSLGRLYVWSRGCRFSLMKMVGRMNEKVSYLRPGPSSGASLYQWWDLGQVI